MNCWPVQNPEREHEAHPGTVIIQFTRLLLCDHGAAVVDAEKQLCGTPMVGMQGWVGVENDRLRRSTARAHLRMCGRTLGSG